MQDEIRKKEVNVDQMMRFYTW